MVNSPSSTYTKTWASCRCGNEAPPGRYSTVNITNYLPGTPIRSLSNNCLTVASDAAARLAAPGTDICQRISPAANAAGSAYCFLIVASSVCCGLESGTYSG